MTLMEFKKSKAKLQRQVDVFRNRIVSLEQKIREKQEQDDKLFAVEFEPESKPQKEDNIIKKEAKVSSAPPKVYDTYKKESMTVA